ncbi:Cephalosporin hydroxylase [Sinorhizobium sojae CCBAU 05684]|uniref:Cephalosporin hydroxylase n=1 Tax=Sinorhizobium sojae CCBAU 05684 TaxID=716928 RepID=A0A249PCB2_9HYPH|nr:Cephalosporin hydroxylase [Sinorhizobium sojae CCBAU 05684]
MERTSAIEAYGRNEEFRTISAEWRAKSMAERYVYNFDWLGRPIIQYPQDIQAIQELVWTTRPDLIIETGIAHGGSLILSASLLALLDMCDAIEAGVSFDPREAKRKVVGVDIDIRAHNRAAIEKHPMATRIEMIQGSSIDAEVIESVKALAMGHERVMVCLDSMHTHDHVLAELEAYAPLVTRGCYCVVFDTFVEELSPGFFGDRAWDVGNNPMTAVHAYTAMHPEFSIDRTMANKLMVTVAPDGFLKRL